MQQSKPDFLYILHTLSKHEVEYIIVGGVCAVLHGAPISTFDIDLVHSREPDNLKRLLKALEELEAYYRDPGGRIIRPEESHLSSPGHQLLMTKGGPLDLLGEIAKGRGYKELLKYTVTLKISEDLEVRLLDLETLIETKEEAAREKDKAVLAILRRTLEEKKRK
jgi:predicted nucleotidyltransferase